VRELRNAVEGACVLAAREVVTLADFERAALGPSRPPPRAPAPRPALSALPGGRRRAAAPAAPAAGAVTIPAEATLAEAERLVVRAALRRHGTRAGAARALGLGLRTLYSKLASWGPEDDAESA
jgi:DNA-binding NtrC family response regulator